MQDLTGAEQAETGALATQMGQALAGMVKAYQAQFGLSREEAVKQLHEDPERFQKWIQSQPPDQISWFDLEQLATSNSEMALQCWQKIKGAARDELQSGFRAGLSLEAGANNCWQRAQFMALRSELHDTWQPQNGVERQLLDTMAIAQANFLLWQARMSVRVKLEHVQERGQQEKGTWQSPRLDDAQAIEQAMQMIDRFNRIFLRCLRSLRDLRRLSPVVVVKKGGQVNMAHQQVNVA